MLWDIAQLEAKILSAEGNTLLIVYFSGENEMGFGSSFSVEEKFSTLGKDADQLTTWFILESTEPD